MDVKTYFDTKREMTEYCHKGQCNDNGYNCPLSIINNGMYVRCSVLEQDYPHIAEAIIQKYINRKENNMTVKDLLKRLEMEDLDKVIVISDGVGWTNISKLSIDNSTITLFEDKSELFTDE